MRPELVFEELSAAYQRRGHAFHLVIAGETLGRMLLLEGPGYLELDLIWISQTARGQGIGARMLDDLCASADRHHVPLFLSVLDNAHSDRSRLLPWYEAHGFVTDLDLCTGDDLVLRRDPTEERLPDPDF